MSNRQVLLRHTKELTNLLESVQHNIEILKNIKDTLPDIDESLRIKEIETERKMELLERNMREKKLETITNVAQELGKIVISPIDMEDLINEINDLRKSVSIQVQEKTQSSVENFKTQLIHEVRIKDLLHEKELAIIDIKMKMKDDEIQSLKDKIEMLQQSQLPTKGIQIGRSLIPTPPNAQNLV
jgi:hypothetical protein